MRYDPQHVLLRNIGLSYRVSVSRAVERRAESKLEPNWLRFRFLRGALLRPEECTTPRCVTCVLTTDPAFPQDVEILFEVSCERLISAASRLLHRKVFSAPVFIDRPDLKGSSMNIVADVLQLGVCNGVFQANKDHRSRQVFFESITQLLLHHWPNSETAEIELGRARRPPPPLRQALAYIQWKGANVGSAMSVADNSGAGLRTLERLFAQWLGIGVSRYCKLLRMKFIAQQHEQTHANLASLAQIYGFTNVSRLRRELSALDHSLIAELEPERVYQRLIDANGHSPASPLLSQLAYAKGI